MAVNHDGELTYHVVKSLITQLKARCPSLKEVYDNFPNPNQKLNYPCGSIFLGKPSFQPCDPYVIYKGALITTGDDAGKYPVRKVIGDHVFNLQIDLWCDSKPSRHKIYKEFFNGFNNNPNITGLSLQMSGYYNSWIHYSIDDLSIDDSEEESQRSEWRIRISIIADCKAIIETNELLIEQIENNLDIPETAIPETPPESGTGII